jgi:translation initiation factor 6
MKVSKFSIRGSPFIGVFCRATEKSCLVPHGLLPKEKKSLEETLQAELVPCSLTNSSLIGVLAIGNQNGFVVPSIIENREIQELQQIGLKIKKVPGVDALGNLVAVNDKAGVCSPHLSETVVKQIESFLKITLVRTTIANSDLAGSAAFITNKGFVCHPSATKNEIAKIRQALELKGNPTSANFGDSFVGNSLVANSNGALVGQNSTPHEMLAIDEALSGEA